MNNNKNVTINLTNQAPVQVRSGDWPVIASADDDSWGHDVDYARHQQAIAQGELDLYLLRVRQHKDGRTLVYAKLCGATAWTGSLDNYGGYLLEAPDNDDLVSSIRSAGEEAGLPNHLIRDCIGDLPATVLE